MIRILVVDDHPLVREGLVTAFGSDPDLIVVGEAASAEEALHRLSRVDPHVISVGVRLPGMSGLDLSALLSRTKPHSRMLVISSYSDDRVVTAAFNSGAHGFVRKGSCPSVLREAVRAVARGETFVDPALDGSLLAQPAAQNPA